MCISLTPPTSIRRAVLQTPSTGISQVSSLMQRISGPTPHPFICLNVLIECLLWASHSAPWWGPLRDQGMSLHGVYRFMAFKHPPECGQFSYKIPFRRLPGAHCGFFSDSAIRCKVELFNGPWAHCCHQRRSEYKCQRVSTTELLVIA